MRDRLSRTGYGSVRLRGLLGSRVDACRENRMLAHDEDYLLWPYERGVPVVPTQSTDLRYYEEVAPLRAPRGELFWIYPRGMAPRPEDTVSDWQGEFIANWVAAASVMAYDADDHLLLREARRGWWPGGWPPRSQMGTSGHIRRATVGSRGILWTQAHNMLALLVYYDVSRQPGALEAARRVADRVLADFGPGQASVSRTGHHGGMASSSVLEPIVLLYRATGDARYLAFARWLVDEDWETSGGPKTVSALASGAGVRAVGNRKALEMLITLIGVIELFRETEEPRYFDAVEAAWADIVERQLYITGSASVGEFFGDAVLPNDGYYDIGETCVTMVWVHFCLQLNRLTGDAKYFEPAERAIYNHLLAAQSEDGRGWAYYVGLRDYKRYREHTDPECCPSRGSRALGMLPGAAIGVSGNNMFVNLFEPLSARVEMEPVGQVRVEVKTGYPFEGVVRVELGLEKAASFGLCLRVPGWCRSWALLVDGAGYKGAVGKDGYVRVMRQWQPGATVELNLEMEPRIVSDALGNAGRVAFVRGPLVYAADVALLREGQLLEDLSVPLGGDGETVRSAPVGDRVPCRLEVRTARLVAGGTFAFGDGGRYRMVTDAEAEGAGPYNCCRFTRRAIARRTATGPVSG